MSRLLRTRPARVLGRRRWAGAGRAIGRVAIDPDICGGQPCIRGTRVLVASLLDGLAEGLTPEGLLQHYPQLSLGDIRAALAYGAELARENTWKVAI